MAASSGELKAQISILAVRGKGSGLGNKLGDFPGGSDGKESACNAGDLDSIPGSGKSPGGEHGNPLQYSCLENPHGQRILTGYRAWGHKESDTTEQLSTAQDPDNE